MAMSRVAANEIEIIRIYNASLQAVWDAWVVPEQVSQWWGPRGFTITTHSKHVETGGGWDYTMHGPDGVDYPNKTKYLQVERHRQMLYDHGGNDDQPPMFRVDVTFAEDNGKTTISMRMILPSAEAATQARTFVKSAGGDTTWDRLGEFLEKKYHGKEVFIINRSFAVPLSTMYQLWTTPDLLAQWSAPTGTTMTFIRPDVVPGKSSFYAMTGERGTMYGRVDYRSFTPTQLMYAQQFCDENEKISRHPMAPTWPETMLTNITFAAEDADTTRVTVTWSPEGEITDAEMATFVGARTG
jgi:uncharacterized protein YndB with AHSA1/START domain